MRNIQSILFLGILLTSVFNANADNSCEKINPTSMANCVNQENDASERQLTETYVRLGKNLQNAQDADGRRVFLKRQLLSSQKQWLKYRKETCKLEGQAALAGNPNRGNLYFFAQAACQSRLAKARTQELQSFGDEYSLWR